MLGGRPSSPSDRETTIIIIIIVIIISGNKRVGWERLKKRLLSGRLASALYQELLQWVGAGAVGAPLPAKNWR